MAKGNYADLFEAARGPGSLDGKDDVAGTYEWIARSIAAFERSAEVNPFSPKFDAVMAGEALSTGEEAEGLALFEGKAMCSACHLSEPGPGGEPPLFTDFISDNLGLPDNPFYDAPHSINAEGEDWIDPGLGGSLAATGSDEEVWMAELGKHKVPTLRNVAKRTNDDFVKAYGHNGVFKSFEEIVHFYNTRDVEPWPAAEVPLNVNTDELGDLGLTPAEEAAQVAFMKSLSDSYMPPAP